MGKILTFFIVLACIVVIGAGFLYIYDTYFINIRNYEPLSCFVGKISKSLPKPIDLNIDSPQEDTAIDNLIYTNYFRDTHLADPEKEIESKAQFLAKDKMLFIYTTSPNFEGHPELILWVYNKEKHEFIDKAMGYIIEPSPLNQSKKFEIPNPKKKGDYELRIFVNDDQVISLDFEIIN